MTMIDMSRLKEAPLKRRPYDYVVTPGFVPEARLREICDDFPEIRRPGSFPLEELQPGPAFRNLIERLHQDDFREAVEEKFDLDLSGRPMTCTVRGATQWKDGRIHTDSLSKLITVLIYLNPEWRDEGGRLRVLNSGDNLDDFAEEIDPAHGNMLIFRRSERSWHGHQPFEGRRRTLQINWVVSRAVAAHERKRHRLSALVKRFNPFAAKAS